MEELKNLYEGRINPLEAVMLVDKKLNGIRGVILRKGLTIETAERRMSISLRGLDKGQERKLEEFAALAYWKARKNRSPRPGEVHIEKGLSSKHYAEAFRAYTNSLLIRYTC